MKRKIIVVLVSMFVSCWAKSVFASTRDDLYIGLDILQTNFVLQDHYGLEVFGKKKPIGYNVYGAYDLHNNFFLEAGYQAIIVKNQATLNGDDYAPGSPNPFNLLAGGAAGAPYLFDAKIRQQFPYLGIGALYALPPSPDTYISAIAGLSIVNIHGWYVMLAAQGFGAVFTQEDLDANRQTMNKTRVSVLGRLALTHKFTPVLGVRLTGTWHKMTQFKIKSDISSAEIRLKDCASVGLGAFYLF